jgi:uncharacterized protein
MNKRWFSLIIAFLFLAGFAGAALALEPFPIKGYVTDRAGLMSEGERQQLGRELWKYDQDTGNQILVVTVPTLEDRETVEFTEALFELNKPGQKGKDNGIILFVAKAERKIRIEVGYGLESAVPDGKAGTIIRDAISPRFKAGDFGGGIRAGAAALIGAISPGYTLADQPAPVRSRPERDRSFPAALVVGLIIFAFVSMAGNRGNQVRQGRLRRGYSEPWYWGGGGFGGGSGSGWGGGSGGGGGFSGGGGSFGGGGASGDW